MNAPDKALDEIIKTLDKEANPNKFHLNKINFRNI